MVVVAHLPKAETLRLAEFEGCAQLEDAHEFEQVGLERRTLGKKMEVVRHEAIGVKKKGLMGRAFSQQGNDAVGDSRLRKVLLTHITADGHKIGLTTDVVLAWEAVALAEDKHTAR